MSKTVPSKISDSRSKWQRFLGLYATWGSIFWLTVFGVLILASLKCSAIKELLTTFGTLLVALIAIWQDRTVDIFNLAGASFIFKGRDPKIQQPFGPGEDFNMYHGEVRSLNPNRPLKNARVIFTSYKKDGELVNHAVPRQFTWAPHESEPRDAFVRREKTFDMFYLNLLTNELFVIIYGNEASGPSGVSFVSLGIGTEFTFHMEIEADNLLYRVHFDLNFKIENAPPPDNLPKLKQF